MNIYDKKLIEKAYDMAKSGVYKDIYKSLNISKKKIAKLKGEDGKLYKKKLSRILRKARKAYLKDGVYAVENTLLKKALGYQITEKTKEIKIDKDGGVNRTIKKYYKHVPPSERAMLVFLENMYPKRWKNVYAGDDKKNKRFVKDDININVGFRDMEDREIKESMEEKYMEDNNNDVMD